MKTLYFDITSGASGDMILSSLIDLGVPVEYLLKELSKLKIEGLSVSAEKQIRSGIAATYLNLKWKSPTKFCHIHQILRKIKSAHYSQKIYLQCEKILTTLGKAEAKVHKIPLEHVHFHEIGAIDTIIDITGVCLALNWLNVDNIFFSVLKDGKGTVSTHHGILPVPVPAVCELAKGFDIEILDIREELLTPTGCALLICLGKQKKDLINGKLINIGYGCGLKVLDKVPNVLRAFLLETKEFDFNDNVFVLESDIDHISGEIMGDVASRLLQKGALDVSWVPVYMKKGRPGYRLVVLSNLQKINELVDTIIFHTRTLGVRIYETRRIIAQRSSKKGKLRNMNLDLKECSFKELKFTKPEYDSLVKISQKTNIPVIQLMEEFVKNNKH